MLSPGREPMPIHHLNGLVEVLPNESSAQDRMPIHHLLPGLLERRGVQIAAQGPDNLHQIHTGLRSVQRMIEDALLHRRERVDVFNLFGVHRDSFRGWAYLHFRIFAMSWSSFCWFSFSSGKSAGVYSPASGDWRWVMSVRSTSTKPSARRSSVA